MKRVAIFLCAAVVAAFLLVSCGQTKSQTSPYGQEVKTDGGVYRQITPVELKSMLEKKDFLLVNVHVPYDGEIAQTDVFLPYNEIQGQVSRLPSDKKAKIVVYCRSGSMSAIAAKALVNLGFTNVWDVKDGMLGWQNQGYDIFRKPQ